MKLIALILTIMLVMLSGCATNKHLYTSDGECITCWNNPITGEPVNHDGKIKATTQSASIRVEDLKSGEGRLKFNRSITMDWALVVLKKEFNFYSKNEIDDLNKSSLNKKTYEPSEHVADELGNNRLLGERTHKDHVLKLDIVLEKTTDSNSIITVTYSPDTIPGRNESMLRNSLEIRFISALNSTPPRWWGKEK